MSQDAKFELVQKWYAPGRENKRSIAEAEDLEELAKLIEEMTGEGRR